MDQLQAVLRDWAPVLARFRRSLRETGEFDDRESLEIVKSIMTAMYRSATARNVDDEHGPD